MSKEKMPTYVYYRSGRWVYYPDAPKGETRKAYPLKHQGKLIKDKAAPARIVIKAYRKLIGADPETIAWLIDQYLSSPVYEMLAARTKRDYKASAEFLKSMPTRNGSALGDRLYKDVTPGVITKLAGKLVEAPTAGKHKLQFLSAVYSWAVSIDMAESNPVQAADIRILYKAIRKKAGTKKYVEDQHFYFALEQAKSLKSFLYPMMIIAYCCRARVGEISRHEYIKETNQAKQSGLKISQIDSKGIWLKRSKGSLDEFTLMSDFLAEGISAAKEYSAAQDRKSKIHKFNSDPYLIRNSRGEPIKKNAFECAWQRLIAKCEKLDPGFQRFRFHELKAKGIDDHRYQYSGHKTESAKAVYLRKIKEIEATK